MQRCLDILDSQTEEALQSDSFIGINHETLQLILGRDTLCIEEMVVYAAVIRWAEAECTRQGCDTSPQQCREVLGESLYLLRFPTMTLDDIANGVGQSELLSDREIVELFLYMTAQNKPKVRFPATKRNGRLMCCRRFQSTKDPWGYSGRPDSIQFSVDKAITVVGFGLYGSCKNGVEYQVDVKLEHNGTLLIQQQHKIVCDGSINTVRVLFDHPVQIQAHTDYTATLFVNNENSGHYGADGMFTVSCGKVNFTFTHSSESTNYTDVGTGQIPEILFRLADH